MESSNAVRAINFLRFSGLDEAWRSARPRGRIGGRLPVTVYRLSESCARDNDSDTSYKS